MKRDRNGRTDEKQLASLRRRIRGGEPEAAIEELDRLLEAHPEDPAARYLLGMACFESGKPEDAVAAFEQARDARPDIPELQTNLGAALAAVGRLEEAADILEKALRADPKDRLARDNLVRIYLETGRENEALAACRERIRALPDDPEGYFLRGHVHLMAGRPGPAAADFEKAVDLDPEDPRYHYNLGYACYVLGREGEAVEAFGTFCQIDPRFSALYVYGNASALIARAQTLARRDGRPGSSRNRGAIIGVSSQMQDLFELLDRVAPRDVTVFITGETGVGKELFAREIHSSSPKKEGPFVPFNASALPNELIESELFGYRKGAFTGALEDRAGLFETASGGTLFLDEIGDLSAQAQAKILRALQERNIRRLGDQKEISIDVRLITATNKNLLQMVQEGSFRSDLYYRLKVIELHVPPLRERPKDIPALAEFFLKKYARHHGLSIRTIEPEAMERLMAYDWPGNARELENAVNSAVVLAGEGAESIRDIDLPPEIVPENRPKPCTGPAPQGDPETERARILQALDQTRWHRGRAAEVLGISRRHIYRLMDKYGIRP